MAFADMLTDLADVFQMNWTAADSGGMKQGTPTTKATAQPCRLQTDGASQLPLGGALGMRISGTVFTNYADGANGDYFDVKDTAGVSSGKWRIVGAPIRRRPIGNMAGFYVYAVEQIETGQ